MKGGGGGGWAEEECVGGGDVVRVRSKVGGDACVRVCV